MRTLIKQKSYFNQDATISTLNGKPLKLVDQFTYLGSNISSTEREVDKRIGNAWTAINWLTIIWTSDFSEKIKLELFQTVAMSIILFGCNRWTLTKHWKKKLDGNYTRILRLAPYKTATVQLFTS